MAAGCAELAILTNFFPYHSCAASPILGAFHCPPFSFCTPQSTCPKAFIHLEPVPFEHLPLDHSLGNTFLCGSAFKEKLSWD